jgi:hypothetical protein
MQHVYEMLCTLMVPSQPIMHSSSMSWYALPQSDAKPTRSSTQSRDLLLPVRSHKGQTSSLLCLSRKKPNGLPSNFQLSAIRRLSLCCVREIVNKSHDGSRIHDDDQEASNQVKRLVKGLTVPFEYPLRFWLGVDSARDFSYRFRYLYRPKSGRSIPCRS